MLAPAEWSNPARLPTLLRGNLKPINSLAPALVITAGPTREAIDPVRYISNHSSGKMGYAIAQAAIDAGADTTLISGPVSLPTPEHAKRIDVQSAEEMYDTAMSRLGDCDIFIATAAVADYRVAQLADQKIKKSAETMSIELVRNPDIVASIANADNRPYTVGFAAETQDVLSYARDKMQRKKLDMIVANDVSNLEIGFNSDENAATILWSEEHLTVEQTSKAELARTLVDTIANQYAQR